MDEEISSGDLVMVVKNNYSIATDDDIGFIANGDVARIRRLRRYEEFYDMRFVESISDLATMTMLNLNVK